MACPKTPRQCRYLCGTIHLKNNITLELAPGAVILASPDERDFDVYESSIMIRTPIRGQRISTMRSWRPMAPIIFPSSGRVVDGNRTKRGGPKTIAIKNSSHVVIRYRCAAAGSPPTSLFATAPMAAPASSTLSRPATCHPCRSCNQESGGAAREPVQHRVAFVPQLLDQPGLRGVVAEKGRFLHVGEKMFGGRGGVLLHGG